MTRPCIALVALILALLTPLHAADGGAYRGLGVEGTEYGEGNRTKCGTDYTNNDERLFQYMGAKGFNLVRIPILWERMQPTLSGPFLADYLQRIKDDVAWARKYKLKVVLDLHNYGRFHDHVIDLPDAHGKIWVTSADLCDFWVKMSNVFKKESDIYAYDLMNEPHNTGTVDFDVVQQRVVTAIRNNGDTNQIAIEGGRGNNYSGASHWEEDQSPTAWITDPANKIVYSAHIYLDSDCSGRYQMTYAQELAHNPDMANLAHQRLHPFVDWCHRNHVRGYIGEFSVPGNRLAKNPHTHVADVDPRWMTLLDSLYQDMDTAGFDATYFAIGIWMSDPKSVLPYNHYSEDTLQMAVILKHLPSKVAPPAP